jgi:GH25 family lysozyme M1 (1,4-beta-N-acetylmuramidase)
MIEQPTTWSLQGFDISMKQKVVPWIEIATQSKFAFAFIEATQGIESSENFASVWNSRDSRILCGPYQIIRRDSSGKQHADALIAHFEPRGCTFGDSDLPPVLDLEDEYVNKVRLPRLPREHYLQIITDWVTEVQTYFKRTPILYMNHDFGHFLDLSVEFHPFPLWLAQYSGQVPTALPPRTTPAFWQFRQDVEVAAYDLWADLDYYSGDLSGLERFVQESRITSTG